MLHTTLEVFTNFKKELNFEKEYKIDEEEDAKPRRQPKQKESRMTIYISMLVFLKETFKEAHTVFEKIAFLEMFGRQ